MTSRLFYILIFCSFFNYNSYCQLGIQVNGSWNYSVGASDISEAGSNFTGTYTSASNQVLIDITYHNNRNIRWRVHVSKQDIDWHSDLNLYVRRTGNGSAAGNGNGNGFVQLGTTYQLITSNSQLFFRGRRRRFDIPIQYEIRDVSVLIPAKTYETTIIYTVTEL